MIRTLFSASLLALPSLASAAELHVGVGYPYTTIQGAVNAASDSDVIVVHGGTYAEQVVIDDASIQNLTLKAYPGDNVLIDAPNSKTTAIIANSVNLRIRGIVIEAPDPMLASPRGIALVSETGTGAETFQLTLCDVTLRDHNVKGGIGIACTVGDNDTLVLEGSGVSISAFTTPVGSTCSAGPDWDTDSGVCAGW